MRFQCIVSFIVLLVMAERGGAQPIEKRLAAAMQKFTADKQLLHAIASLSVADGAGKTMYRYNDAYGLAPASNMKVFTAIAALDLLGSDYQYATEAGYSGAINDSTLTGNLYIVGQGDPTFGSWRYSTTKPTIIVQRLAEALRNKGINTINGQLVLDGGRFAENALPGGWSWADMGNYYGAGTWALNWNENQYDITLQPGKRVGDAVKLLSAKPALPYAVFINKLTTGAAGSGDNSLVFMPPYSRVAILEGTVPIANSFIVSGSLPEPYTAMAADLEEGLAARGIRHKGGYMSSFDALLQGNSLPRPDSLLYTFLSPPLDSLIYFFMKKSINLYGEDLIKTFSLQQQHSGSTEDGVKILKQYWTAKGIDSSAINFKDGSGLSAETRVTTAALVQALLYARGAPWYGSFYNSLPLVNNMHMKTGTISGVKAFSGYQTSSSGEVYTFSFIVNNYTGATSAVVEKMYQVLNELKK